MASIKWKYYSRYELQPENLEEMFNVFKKYYEHVDFKTFKNDFDKKNGAFILRENWNGKIVGFSTLLEMKMNIGGKKVVGIFSGDTVIETKYWGKTSLNPVYFKYFVKTKLLNPFTGVYWFLISKGYKTYLLLANNFLRHYPSYNSSNKGLKAVVDAYCQNLFPEYYDEETGLLNFGETSQCLKSDVAAITPEMCQKYPKIAFFNKVNPTWHKGTELPCIGEISILPVIYRFFKPLRKLIGLEG